MKVILLQKMRQLGDLGEQVTVKKGYGRNYLIPQGKAVLATSTNLKEFELRRAELEKMNTERLALATERAETITQLGNIYISARTGDEGRLFGSIGSSDIVKALSDAGITIARAEVRLPETLRQTGEYDIELLLQGEVPVILKLVVKSEA